MTIPFIFSSESCPPNLQNILLHLISMINFFNFYLLLHTENVFTANVFTANVCQNCLPVKTSQSMRWSPFMIISAVVLCLCAGGKHPPHSPFRCQTSHHSLICGMAGLKKQRREWCSLSPHLYLFCKGLQEKPLRLLPQKGLPTVLGHFFLTPLCISSSVLAKNCASLEEMGIPRKCFLRPGIFPYPLTALTLHPFPKSA